MSLSKQEIDTRINEALIEVGIESLRHSDLAHLSGGELQKVALAETLAMGAEIILLDEPFNGLDFSSVLEVKKILGELIQEGKTILLTSHHQQDLDAICDELYIIDDYHLKILTDEIRNEYFQ